MSARKSRNKRRLSIHGPTPAERKWTRIIEKWRQSKLPGSTFCRKRGYPQSAFRFWLREIPERQSRRKSRGKKTAKRKPAMRFLQARMVPDKGKVIGLVPLEVVVSNGRTVRIAEDFNPIILQKLLDVLEARP